MSDTILVVGATGNVGSRLTRLLAERGQRVRAATRSPDTYLPPVAGVEAILYDSADPPSTTQAVEGVAKVFLMAPPGDIRAEQHLIPVIDRARHAGVEHIVLMTAMGMERADAAPLRRVEKFIESGGVPFTFLRPNWFMQNFYPGSLYDMIRRTGTFAVPAGDAATSFISTADIAAVAAAVFLEPGHRGQMYALTGGQALTHGDVARILSAATGRDIRYVAIEDADMRQQMAGAGMEPAAIEYMSIIFGALRAGLAAPVTDAVERITGSKPVTFEEFAEENAAAFRT